MATDIDYQEDSLVDFDCNLEVVYRLKISIRQFFQKDIKLGNNFKSK